MNEKGFGPAELDVSSANPAAIRGREQMLIESNVGAKSMGGISGNTINGAGPINHKPPLYLKSETDEFGPRSPIVLIFPGTSIQSRLLTENFALQKLSWGTKWRFWKCSLTLTH